jgi:hypothetical protein
MDDYPAIADHGLIGDLQTAALVDNCTCERPACQWVNNSTRSSIKIFLLAISALPSVSQRMQSEPSNEAHTGQTHRPGWGIT